MEKSIKGFSNYTITEQSVIVSKRCLTKHGTYSYRDKILKQTTNSNGYKVVKLVSDKGAPKLMQVHRLMGLTFLDNPKNFPMINHIDGNKANNYINNLEWCTAAHNNAHVIATGLHPGISQGVGILNHKSKSVEQIDPTTNKVIAVYESARLAAKAIGNKSQGNISMVCRGERPLAYGFKWKYSKS